MARRRRRTKAESAVARAIKMAARAADAELYRAQCSVCERVIRAERVLSGQSTRTVCGGACALKAIRAREAAKEMSQ